MNDKENGKKNQQNDLIKESDKNVELESSIFILRKYK